MARTGRPPKPPRLRLVTGVHRDDRHGNAAVVLKQEEEVAAAFGPLVKPKSLKGHALVCWRDMIEPASWWMGRSSKYAASSRGNAA